MKRRQVGQALPSVLLRSALQTIKFPVDTVRLLLSVFPEWMYPALIASNWGPSGYVGTHRYTPQEQNVLEALVGGPDEADKVMYVMLAEGGRIVQFWTRMPYDKLRLRPLRTTLMIPRDLPFYDDLLRWHGEFSALWEEVCRAELDWATISSLNMNEDEVCYALPELGRVLGYDRDYGDPTVNAVRFKNLLQAKIPQERITRMIELVATAAMISDDDGLVAGVPSMIGRLFP